MEDKEIIKALDICSSKHLGCEDGCPRRDNGLTFRQCRSVLQKDALDLINRQQVEIERLKDNNQKLYDEMAERQKEEVTIAKRMSKAEAIKEFAERLKENCDFFNKQGKPSACTLYVIDKVVKEMVGDEV